MNPKAVSTALLFSLIATAYVALAVIYSRTVISNTATVKAVGLGAYWDSQCTSIASSISWGMLEPDSSKSEQMYVKNEGNSPVLLNMTTKSWNPTNAHDYVELAWDYDGRSLAPADVLPISLTLSLSPDTTGITTFTFDIVFSSEGQGIKRLGELNLGHSHPPFLFCVVRSIRGLLSHSL